MLRVGRRSARAASSAAAAVAAGAGGGGGSRRALLVALSSPLRLAAATRALPHQHAPSSLHALQRNFSAASTSAGSSSSSTPQAPGTTIAPPATPAAAPLLDGWRLAVKAAIPFNKTIAELARKSDVGGMMDVLDNQMKAAGVQADVVTYSTIIEVLSRSDCDAALALYGRMKQDRVQPNVFTLTSLLKVLAKAGRLEDMRSVYEEATRRFSVRAEPANVNVMMDAFKHRNDTKSIEWCAGELKAVLAQQEAAKLHTALTISFPFSAVQDKWQKIWAEEAALRNEPIAVPIPSPAANAFTDDELAKRAFGTSQAGQPYYVLPMFPYPSGRLHMGHVRVYTISDCLARLGRMQGRSVLHPIGWDAFGLPAENAAIERNISPAVWTHSNIAEMCTQLRSLGVSFDWQRELRTCEPEYYRWTQWLFLQLLKNDMAYQREAYVNWDPVDHTVLANEQVDAEGRSWRSGALVEQKLMRQWFIRLTPTCEALLGDLDQLNEWPSDVKAAQRFHIGRAKGAVVKFGLQDASGKAIEGHSLSVFTTRPDTLFGVTFLATAVDHALWSGSSPLLSSHVSAEVRQQIQQYQHHVLSGSVAERRRRATTAKTGLFSSLYAVHPITGAKLPVYLAEYVLPDYASGAIMGVPAHDARDNDFAVANKLAIVHVVRPRNEAEEKEWQSKRPNQQRKKGEKKEKDSAAPTSDPAVSAAAPTVFEADGVLLNSGAFSGLHSADAGKAIVAELKKRGAGDDHTSYRLRDWLVSRQRYWGVPIPIIHCTKCGPVPVPENQLPVVLPEGLSFNKARGRGSPLASDAPEAKAWREDCGPCPKCGATHGVSREVDTLDTFVDSAWYYLRYLDHSSKANAFPQQAGKAWLPVNAYIGGKEHSVGHLLYARFIHKFLRSMKLVDSAEPFQRLIAPGMVRGLTYKHPVTGRYCRRDEVQFDEQDGKPFIWESDASNSNRKKVFLSSVFEKMSKSKQNGVDPHTILLQYGADVARLYVLKAPVENDLDWSENDIAGIKRWVDNIWTLVVRIAAARASATAAVSAKEEKEIKSLKQTVQQTVKHCTRLLSPEQHDFNSALVRLLRFSESIDAFAHSFVLSAPATPSAAAPKPAAPAKQPSPAALCAAQEALNVLLRLMYPMAPHFVSEAWLRLELPLTSLYRWPYSDEAAGGAGASAAAATATRIALRVGGQFKAAAFLPSVVADQLAKAPPQAAVRLLLAQSDAQLLHPHIQSLPATAAISIKESQDRSGRKQLSMDVTL